MPIGQHKRYRSADPPSNRRSGHRVAGVSPLTQDQIAVKIATAEAGLAAATTVYGRNQFAQIIEEYRRYAEQRAKEIAKLAAPAAQ